MEKGVRVVTKRQKIVLAVMLPILLASVICACWPWIHGWFLNRARQQTVSDFFERVEQVSDEAEPYAEGAEPPKESENPTPDYTELYEAMLRYNQEVYESRQRALGDAWDYTPSDFDLASYGVESEVVGVVEIPSLNISMPLYLGASYDHMAAGCTQLTGTSMPIGGINTNCVIAGHCGWGGASYFRYLSTIEEGALVYVTNLWETLVYRVESTRIIVPYDLDKIMIQEGRDMITLFTCHPYASGGRYRFVVYCERVTEDAPGT